MKTSIRGSLRMTTKVFEQQMEGVIIVDDHALTGAECRRFFNQLQLRGIAIFTPDDANEQAIVRQEYEAMFRTPRGGDLARLPDVLRGEAV